MHPNLRINSGNSGKSVVRIPLFPFAGDAGDIAAVTGKFAAVAVFIAAVGGKQFPKQKKE